MDHVDPRSPTTAASPSPERGPTGHPVRRFARVVTAAIYVYVVIVEVVLAAGFVCLLVGIEPSSWLADWIYRSVERVMSPYRGLFGALEVTSERTGDVEPVVETSLLFAMIVYGIVALAAHDLIGWLTKSTDD